MEYPANFSNESELRECFSYQTRIGIAPKFGSRSISWYQMHQCEAHDYIMTVIRDMKMERAKIRVRKGMLQIMDASGNWQNNISTFSIYKFVDMNVRKG